MRIIGGNFKGKKILEPKDKETRPLKDLTKESIFNLIQHSNKINLKIENSIVLDLFAGIGSFGIECLSRGAKKVIFFENYPQVINVLKKNLKSLKKNKNYEVFLSDCFDFFESRSICAAILVKAPINTRASVNICVNSYNPEEAKASTGSLLASTSSLKVRAACPKSFRTPRTSAKAIFASAPTPSISFPILPLRSFASTVSSFTFVIRVLV